MVEDNIELLKLAEKFGDPLLEKVPKLSVYGWKMWLAYFKMVDKRGVVNSRQQQIDDAPMHPSRGFRVG